MLHINEINRLREIVTVFFEEELGYYINRARLHIHLPFHKKILPTRPLTDKEAQAVRLRRAFERLGPTFVKLGQLLSLRPDLVPSEYCKEFEKLQDRVPSFAYSQVKSIIEDDLKKPIGKLFKSFNKKPIASASIAQVHEAVLPSGKKVAVKVQRPKIKETIDADLEILFHIAHSLERHFPEIKNYRPTAVVKEFALWTRKELNFEIEGRNAALLREEMKNNVNVFVPKVYKEYSSRRVLTLEFVDGVKINNLPALKRYRINRRKLGMTYFTSILEQALLYGLFHADPHPANIFINRKGKLIYLDYGIMGELSLDDRKKVVDFIQAIPENDADKCLNIIISLARDTSQADIAEFKNEASEILKDLYTTSIGQKSYALALYELISCGAKHGVIFDANHVLMAKSFYQAEGLGRKLCPDFKVGDGLKVFAEKYLKEKYSPIRIAKEMRRTIWTNKELILELPEHIAKIIKKLETPDSSPQFNVSQLKEFEWEIEYVNRRRNFGMIIASLIVASSIMFYLEGRTTLFGVQLSILLFILALALLFYFLFTHKKDNGGE